MKRRRVSPKARKAYRAFHKKNPDKMTTAEFTMPKSLIRLGSAVAVEYRSDKPLAGVRKNRIYRHKFGRNVILYCHPNRRWLFVSGGNFRVTDWLRD